MAAVLTAGEGVAELEELTFQVEPCDVILTEGRQLMLAHWEDVGRAHGLPEPDPDAVLYRTAEAAGNFLLVAARAPDGRLAGYFAVFLRANPHYRTVMMAAEDVHYIDAPYRSYRNFRRLLSAAEDAARARGAMLMTARTKITRDHGMLFVRAGYEPMDVTFLRRL